MSEIDIEFSIIGTCRQTIKLLDDCPYTIAQIMDALNGESDLPICTTVQEGGELVEFGASFSSGQRKLGVVVASDVDGEYTDFEVP
jgi:hypothetical protein